MKDMIPAWVNGKLNPVEKLDVHVRGLRHKAISVFVLDGEELRDRVEYRADVGNDLTEHEVVDIFVGHMSKDQSFTPNPLEVAQTQWMKLSDLYERVKTDSGQFTPWVKIYLDMYGERIFGSALDERPKVSVKAH